MTSTQRKFLVRRLGASAIVAALIAVGLARAFAGGSPSPAPDEAAALVPGNALVYLNLGTNRHSVQWRRLASVTAKLPVVGQLRSALFTSATSSALGRLNLERDVVPWVGSEAAYAELPGRGQKLLVLRVRDIAAARTAFAAASRGQAPVLYRGTLLHPVGPSSMAALNAGWAFIGAPAAVRSALDLSTKHGGSLASNATYRELTSGLPRARIGNGWLTQTWLNAHLHTPTAILAGAARVRGIQAAAVSLGDDGKRVVLALRARPLPGPPPGAGCTGEAGQSDSLVSMVPAHPALFVGLGGAECAVRELMAGGGSVGKALRSFASQARKAGVDVNREVLPLLGGDSALSLEPGPTITLYLGDVPVQQGMNVLGRLQPALVKLLNPEAGGAAPDFSAQTVNGVTALTASLTPSFQLSYAALGGDLVVSTSLQGIAEATKGDHLDKNPDFKMLLADRPKSPSALVFLDLKKFLALADEAGLGSNPTYAAVRDDLRKIDAAGAVLSREGNDIDAELRLKNP